MTSAAKALQLIELGQWDLAHNLVQDKSDKISCLIHAYLHREEGDKGNAAYWYRRANEEFPQNSLTDELERLYELVNARVVPT